MTTTSTNNAAALAGELFAGIDRATCRAALALATPARVPAGAFLFQQGDPACHFYVLARGRVKMLQLTPDGHQIVLRLLVPGEMIGSVASGERAVYPAAAQALDEVVALRWDRRALIALMDRHPVLSRNILTVMAGRMRDIQDRYRELATEQVEQRVARAILRLVRHNGRKTPGGVLIDAPLSRQDLAELSGTTLYTVSRLLTRWEQQGLVEVGRKRLLVTQPHGLVAVAEHLGQPD